MPKAGELMYLSAMPEGGKTHAENKPFSAPECGRMMIDVGTVRAMLPAPPCRLLDLGCGTGWTSCFFAKMGYDVVGQDIAPDMIQSAIINKQRHGAESANFVVSDYESMTFEDEFDAACFYDSLHHAEDELAALEAVHRALKPGGVCVTHEPGEGHSENEHTLQAVQQYGVTEKDMPPEHIIQIARKIGYSSANFFPFPADVIDIILRDDAQTLDRDAERGAGWIQRAVNGWQRLRYRQRVHRRINNVINGAIRHGGLVVLTK